MASRIFRGFYVQSEGKSDSEIDLRWALCDGRHKRKDDLIDRLKDDDLMFFLL